MNKRSLFTRTWVKWLLITTVLIVVFFILVRTRQTRVAPPPQTPQQLAAMVPIGYPQATPHPLKQQYKNCIACHNVAEIAGHDRKLMQQCLQCHVAFE